MRTPMWKLALVLVSVLLFAFGCSKKSATAPSKSTNPPSTSVVRKVTLTTSKTQIQPGGVDYATLRATASDSAGKGVSGVTVHFTSKIGTGVSLLPDSGLTDSAGEVVSTLKSQTAVGLDTITASVTTTGGTYSAKVGVTYSSYTLVIDSLASSVPPGNGTMIRATVSTSGTPVPGDTLVWSVTTGHSSQIFNIDSLRITDANGHGRAPYLAGPTTGFDTVSATDAKRNLTTQTTISIGGGTPEDTIPASIIIQSVSSYFLTVRGGGGIEKSNITIQVLNRNGTGMKKPVRVDFTFVQPLGGGEFFAPSSGLTSSTDGTLTTALNTGTKSGTLKFKATVFGTTISTNPTLITIRSGPPDPAHFTILTDKCILPGRTRFLGDEANITVYLADIWGNPVVQTAVWFFTSECMIYPGSATTDETGACTNTFRTSLPNDSSYAWVTAQTRDSSGTPIYKSLAITVYGPLAAFSLTPTNWVIHTHNPPGPTGIRFTLDAEDDHHIGLPGTYLFEIHPEGWTDPSTVTFTSTDCNPPTQNFTFLAADTITPGYQGSATVTATWTGTHQSYTVVDSGNIYKP